MRYDVFNGDADGLCALRQLRLAEPVETQLVTGLKRDLALLARVPAVAGDEVTVLDISLARNRDAVERILEAGARVTYFDHHDAGALPRHPAFKATIETSPGVCTAMLVDRHLRGRFRAWAVVGAFGDNLLASATALAATLGLDGGRIQRLRELGECLNYNAYGDTEADVLSPPAEVYRLLARYADPFVMLREEPLFARLSAERRADLAAVHDVRPMRSSPATAAWMLPDAAGSRRVSGTFANRLARLEPGKAHAVLTPAGGGFLVSVRCPQSAPMAASAFCARFDGGGGRALSGGIDRLPGAELDRFLADFERTYK